MSSFINRQLLPGKREKFISYAAECENEYITAAAYMDAFSFFADGMKLVMTDVWKTVTSGAGQQGVHGVPQQPLFVYKAVGDEVSPVADTDDLVNRYCADGVRIQYQRNHFGEHITESTLGSPAAFMWLKDRFAGVPIRQTNTFKNCEIQDVFITRTDDEANGRRSGKLS